MVHLFMDKKHQERIHQLLTEGAIPETTGEELLVYMYEGGMNGHSLQELTIEVSDEFNIAEKYELEMILIGYMLGQTNRDNITDNKQIH